MPRLEVTETLYYKYEELSEKAKQKAVEEVCEWNRQVFEPDWVTENLENDLLHFYGLEHVESNKIYWSTYPNWAAFSGYAYWTSKTFLDENGPKDLWSYRSTIHRLASELTEVGWSIGSIDFKGDGRYGGIDEVIVTVDEEPSYGELVGDLLDWFNWGGSEPELQEMLNGYQNSPLKAMLQGHGNWNSPPMDWAMLHAELDKLKDDGIDISEPLEMIRTLGPEAEKRHREVFDELEAAAKAWGEAICEALSDTVQAEIDHNGSDEYALEMIEQYDDFEFDAEGNKQ